MVRRNKTARREEPELQGVGCLLFELIDSDYLTSANSFQQLLTSCYKQEHKLYSDSFVTIVTHGKRTLLLATCIYRIHYKYTV